MRAPAFLLAVVLVLSACAANRARKSIRAKLEPLMGATKAEVLRELGPPTNKLAEDNIEVWGYYKSQGASAHTSYIFGAPVTQVKEKYDSFTITFEDGVAVTWRMRVER